MNDHGYATLARCEALRGSSPERIAWVCEAARLDNVPGDVVFRELGVWVRDAEVTDPVRRLSVGLAQLGVSAGAVAGELPVRQAEAPGQEPRPEPRPEPQAVPGGRPSFGTLPVQVRWSVLHEAIVEVPAEAAGSGRDALAWLARNPGWMTAEVAYRTPDRAPRISEVVVPRLREGLASVEDLAELAERVREVIALANASADERKPLLR